VRDRTRTQLPLRQVPLGPKVQDNSSGKKSQNRTWTDLLKDEHDGELFAYYGTSELLLVDVRLDGGDQAPPPRALGPPRMYTECVVLAAGSVSWACAWC
jgi:hypothetical protein